MSHSDTLLYPLLLLLLPVLHTLHPYSKLYSHSSYNCILQMSRDWIKLRNGLLCCSQYKISFCLVIIIVISFHITQQLSKHLLFFALVWYYYGIRFKIVDTCCYSAKFVLWRWRGGWCDGGLYGHFSIFPPLPPSTTT